MKALPILLTTWAALAIPCPAQDSPLAKPLQPFDTNKDGKLTGEEVVLARQAFNRGGKELEFNPRAVNEFMERRKKTWREQQLAYLDLDGNGSIDETENKRAELIWSEMRAEFDKSRAEMLLKYDKNDDGELNQQEREASRPEWDARRKAIEEKVMASHPKPSSPTP